MQFIRDIYAAKGAAGQAVISFEFFPPKTPEGDANLLNKTIPALRRTRPDYCSVTYGAGGSTREKTLKIVDSIQREHGLTAVAHLTCVDATREQIGELLGQIRALGVRNVLALRGDPPGGGGIQASPRRLRILQPTGPVHPPAARGRPVHWRGRLSRRPHRLQRGQARGLAPSQGEGRGRR